MYVYYVTCSCYTPTARCPELLPIVNGFITYGPDDVADFDIGTVATYECNPGFFLIGVMTRDCVEAADGTGVFNGVAPVCECKDFFISNT